ncbi:MAG: SDR family NAD(P)-dependent oxidoreductase [Polyangiaceae bacterium]
MKRACVVGSSDGIGFATAEALLAEGREVVGVSRGASALSHAHYAHFTCDVTSDDYRRLLREHSAEPFQAVIYSVGIGEALTLDDLSRDIRVLDVNLMAAVSTAAIVLPGMIASRQGSLIVLSSLADVLVSSEYPSYNASKAALSSYFEGLGTALRSSNVTVSSIRFGFVDTKMAKARTRPLMVSRQVAAGVVMHALRTGQRRVSFPVRMALLVSVLRFFQSLKRIFE